MTNLRTLRVPHSADCSKLKYWESVLSRHAYQSYGGPTTSGGRQYSVLHPFIVSLPE